MEFKLNKIITLVLLLIYISIAFAYPEQSIEESEESESELSDIEIIKCGPNNDNQSCPSGYCCGPKGFCGKLPVYCGYGCQELFGECDSTKPIIYDSEPTTTIDDIEPTNTIDDIDDIEPINYHHNKSSLKNNYYMIAILRDVNDINYDDTSLDKQIAVNKLINDRMNEILYIIYENRDSYEDDEILKKENIENLFPTKDNKDYLFKHSYRTELSNGLNTNDLIPLDISLVYPLCTVSNYFVIVAYLSNDILNVVKHLPYVLYIEEDQEGFLD